MTLEMNNGFIEKYFYIWIICLILPLWIGLYLKNRKRRTEILYIGIVFGIAAMLLDRYCSFYDYWHPPVFIRNFNFESFLYGFFFGGIAAVIHDSIFKKHDPVAREPRFLILLLITVFSIGLYGIILILTWMNSIYIFLLVMFCNILLFFIINRTLVTASLLSGIIMVLLNILWYALILWIYPAAVEDIWYGKNLTGLSLWGVPIEEHIYIFLLGSLGSMTYKIITGTKNHKQPMPTPNRTGIRFKTLLLPMIMLLLTIGYIAVFGEKGRVIRDKSFRSTFGSIKQTELPAGPSDRPFFNIAKLTLIA